MFVTLIGKDQFSKDKRIEKFLSETLGDRISDPMAKQVLYATDTNIASISDVIIEACDSVSMFSPEQVIVVRKAEALKTDDMKALAKWLPHAASGKLLFDFESLLASSELYKALAKVGKVEKFDVPKQYEMADWISAVVPTHFNKAIEPAASQYLAEALGNDTKLVSEEVEKIILYAPDCKKITLDLVKTMVVSQRDIPTYEIEGFFGMQDAKAYVQKLNELLNSGVDAIRISNTLYNYALSLLNYGSLTAKGVSPEEAAKKIGKNYYMFVKKGQAAECCRRWRKPLLVRVLRRLADLNYEMKSGKCPTRMSQELALAALVVR